MSRLMSSDSFLENWAVLGSARSRTSRDRWATRRAEGVSRLMSSDSFLEIWEVFGVGAITDVSRSVGEPASGGCAQALAVSPFPASLAVSQTVVRAQCFGELPAIPHGSSAGSPFRNIPFEAQLLTGWRSIRQSFGGDRIMRDLTAPLRA